MNYASDILIAYNSNNSNNNNENKKINIFYFTDEDSDNSAHNIVDKKKDKPKKIKKTKTIINR